MRSNAIYDATVFALTVVLVIGVITMFLGAIIASAKDDMPRVAGRNVCTAAEWLGRAHGRNPVIHTGFARSTEGK